MTFGKNLAVIRKEKGLSQSELADKIDSIAITIGRYEREEVKPSVEVAAKIANALGVSLDYLAGNTDLLIDKATLDRIAEIQKLSDDDKKDAYKFLDAFLRDAKARKAYAH